MINQQESNSERLAETISKFQDQIQDTKFAIATLRIQLAFKTLMKISEQKIAKASVIFLQRIKEISIKKIAFCIERPITMIFETLQKVKERTMIKTFVRIKVYSQTVQKESSSSKKNLLTQSITDSRKKIAINNNGYQIISQEMEEECIFLKDQIKKIEKSFQDFYNNLQKH